MTEHSQTLQPAAQAPASAVPAADWSPLQRHYLLGVLCVVGIFNFIDRQIISILLEPIKQEFGASDTQMGLLTGLIFAVFYAVGSIPLARLAERYSRKWVISISVLVWSIFTSLGGFAQNFVQLAMSRLGVAVAEGGALPISQSIITDIYPKSSRARAFAALAGAQALGIGVSVFLGGWLSEHFGWRAGLLVVGVPGILLFLLIVFTVKEPPRGMSDGKIDAADPPPLGVALRTLWSLRSYRCLVLNAIFCGMTGLAFMSWGPTFLLRVHDMSQVAVGAWYGLAVSASLILGAIVGGILGDRFGRSGIKGYVWVATTGPLLSVVPALFFAFSSDWPTAVVSLFFWSLLLMTYQPICVAMVQNTVPIRMRATAAVVLSLGTGLIGTGLAPVLVGVLNDFFEPTYGQDAIRLSLGITALFGPAGAAAAALAAVWLRKDIQTVHGDDAPLTA